VIPNVLRLCTPKSKMAGGVGDSPAEVGQFAACLGRAGLARAGDSFRISQSKRGHMRIEALQ
jgi:hypothetical protein